MNVTSRDKVRKPVRVAVYLPDHVAEHVRDIATRDASDMSSVMLRLALRTLEADGYLDVPERKRRSA
jgi:hypothetical protein